MKSALLVLWMAVLADTSLAQTAQIAIAKLQLTEIELGGKTLLQIEIRRFEPKRFPIRVENAEVLLERVGVSRVEPDITKIFYLVSPKARGELKVPSIPFHGEGDTKAVTQPLILRHAIPSPKSGKPIKQRGGEV